MSPRSRITVLFVSVGWETEVGNGRLLFEGGSVTDKVYYDVTELGSSEPISPRKEDKIDELVPPRLISYNCLYKLLFIFDGPHPPSLLFLQGRSGKDGKEEGWCR